MNAESAGLRRFVTFAYGVVLVGIFTGVFRGGIAIQWRDLFENFVAQKQLFDELCLAILILLTLIQYFVVSERDDLTRAIGYGVGLFSADLAILFGFFAAAEWLGGATIRSLVERRHVWMGVVAVYIAVLLRLAVTAYLVRRSARRGGVEDPSRGAELVDLSIGWYAFSILFLVLGWYIDKPKFDAVASIRALAAALGITVVLGWFLQAAVSERPRLRAVPLALGVSGSLGLGVWYWVDGGGLVQTVIENRYGVSMAGLQLLSACVFGIGLALRDHLRAVFEKLELLTEKTPRSRTTPAS